MLFSCSVSDSLNGAVRLWREDEPKVRREHLYTSLSLRDSYQWATSLQLVYSEQVLSVLIYIQSKPLTVWITTNCGTFLKRWEYQTTLHASSEICMQVRKQQLELDMEQPTGSKLGKGYVKAVYCHPAYLTSCEMPSWMKHKLESRLNQDLNQDIEKYQ